MRFFVEGFGFWGGKGGLGRGDVGFGIPIVGQVRPLCANELGPWPKILNQLAPEPSHVATFEPDGTLAMYTWSGPGW